MFKNLFQNWFNEPQQLDYANYSACKNYYYQNYPELRKLLVGENDQDVICVREIDDPRFNTNIDSYIGGLEEMNWGYAGTGPWTLALNILYTFTNGDRKFAYKHVCAFRADFLVRDFNQESFKISAVEVNQWITNKKQQGEAFVQ